MKTSVKALFFLSFFSANLALATTPYWFNTDGTSRQNDFSNTGNWFNIWPGGTDYKSRGNTPADIIDAEIYFQSKELNVDSAVTMQTSHAFNTDKTVFVYGEAMTFKNMTPTNANNSSVIVDLNTTNVKSAFTMDNDVYLASASTAYTTKYYIYNGGNSNTNTITFNGNISLLNEKIDSAYTSFEDDVLNISCTSVGNTFLNGKIDLTRYTSDTYSWAARVYVSSNASIKAQKNSYAYFGGSQSNVMSSVKVTQSGSIVLAKTDGATLASQIELRNNSMVTFMYDNQTSKYGQLRAIDARYDYSFEGDAKHARTAAFLYLNNTNQGASSIAFEWDKWQGGSKDVIAAGTYQYVQIDFGDGASMLTLTDKNMGIDMAANLAIDYDSNLRLQTDVAKSANRENAIKSGLILSNFDYAAGDRLYSSSNLIKLADAKYYDDISLISTDLADHIWLAEGEKGVDYNLYFELQNDGTYSLVITAIPEPAAITTILGALALGCAVYRRRK